ncbi:hypothetical protein [Neobacillus kokaensis]|uniref:Uncharacterized protein n=1 Tax=Neobacillus kokaensis TaxID=2759023 RepID=A0ABQ3N2E9_9BACI|nr:hypothetical protein [Neobacillus kokaensis]GHH98769.1 hypothetical protein AM1BK_23120 [Neobacillus kokaensis]
MKTSPIVLVQFIFPILAILLLASGIAGASTLEISHWLLLPGFLLSVFLIAKRNLFLWGMLNIGLTVLTFIGAFLIYFKMIAAGS